MNFFRAQHKGHSIEEMKVHRTFVDIDPITCEEIRMTGVCATLSPDGGSNSFGNAAGAMEDDDEIIVFTGRIVKEIYDGYVVEPKKEIARFCFDEWIKKIDDESAWDYEDWE